MPAFRTPTYSQRTTVIGRTGTGKSVLALWLLSRVKLDQRPALLIDYKGEPMFNRLDRQRVTKLRPGRDLPERPGLYYMQPLPRADDLAVEETLWSIWERGDAALFLDETTQIKDTVAFESLWTQGRTKRIQIIACTQQPVWVPKYVFTQSDYFACFPIRDREHQQRVEDLLGERGIMQVRRPEHHSLWYDVAKDQLIELTPTPHPDDIIARINAMAPRRPWLWR